LVFDLAFGANSVEIKPTENRKNQVVTLLWIAPLTPNSQMTARGIRRPVSAAGADKEFLRALRDGVRPDGANYFPVFPYPSFTKITDADVQAIKAYLFSLPAVRQANRAHDVSFPFSWRLLQTILKLLFFSPGPFRPAPERAEAYNRGTYLVTALAHCGECHTRRNWFGATEPDRFLAGNPHGPDGKPVPNITPDPQTGIGDWTEETLRHC
jgi:mono/diheme cytochrome c family protein